MISIITLYLKYTEETSTTAQSLVISMGRGASHQRTEGVSQLQDQLATPQKLLSGHRDYNRATILGRGTRAVLLLWPVSHARVSSTQQAAHQLYPAKGACSQRIKLGSPRLCRAQQRGRGGCASWADRAWAQHPTCPCLQPQPGVYC